MAGIFHGTDASEQNTSLTENVFYGGDGNDSLLSTEAAVYADGGRGDDFIGANGTTGVGELYGGAGNDQLFGRQGNDKLYGGEGDDWLVAAASFVGTNGSVSPSETSGNDYMEGGAGTDAVYGFDGNDVLYGGGGNDKGAATVANINTWNTPGASVTVKAGLYGGDGDDLVDGGTGDDLVSGGQGKDVLHGGSGADQFLFDAALNASSNVDRIADFSRGDGDKLLLSEAIFDGIGTSLARNEFVLGNKAKDGNDHILFNQKKGFVYYDEDGKGGSAKVLFATVEKGIGLTHTDFDMV